MGLQRQTGRGTHDRGRAAKHNGSGRRDREDGGLAVLLWLAVVAGLVFVVASFGFQPWVATSSTAT